MSEDGNCEYRYSGRDPLTNSRYITEYDNCINERPVIILGTSTMQRLFRDDSTALIEPLQCQRIIKDSLLPDSAMDAKTRISSSSLQSEPPTNCW
jgi:hypothetical protein